MTEVGLWGARDIWDRRVSVDGPELRSADPLRLLLPAGLLRLRDWLQPVSREKGAVVKARVTDWIRPAAEARTHSLPKSPGPVGTSNAAVSEDEQPKDRGDPGAARLFRPTTPSAARAACGLRAMNLPAVQLLPT
ncbi:hypothetical protein OJAV_G00136700 [Oryzias javanicus]|uniref:Uncharacterized protein n=1 Tax=Oryzias javanicus TaxID=123683 RepID=A0A3S2MAU7_ORYJA|nr:hypothetical protein OJAV_G00136700 [Oryzias javanicus]